MALLTPDETLLGVIAVQPTHGYELIEIFRDRSALGAVWKMSTSQIYAVLKRLEQAGLIVGHEVVSDSAPNRLEYTLTASGEARLLAWLHDANPSASIRRVRVEFMSRLYVARRLGLPLTPLIEHQGAVCAQQYRALEQSCTGLPDGMERAALLLEMAQLNAIQQWLFALEQTCT